MKIIMTAVLAALVSCSYSAMETETVDGVVWTYRVENGDAIVGGNDGWDAYRGTIIENNIVTAIDRSISGEVAIPSTLGGRRVVGINRMAFYLCKISGIEIPNTVTNIGFGAFCGVVLNRVSIPGSVVNIEGLSSGGYRTFSDDVSSVILNEGLETIGCFVFNSASLRELKIPATVKKMDVSSFHGSNGITETGRRKIFFVGDVPAIENESTSHNYYSRGLKDTTLYYVEGNETWEQAETSGLYGATIACGAAPVALHSDSKLCKGVYHFASTNSLLDIGCNHANATIYYTLDGSEPTRFSLRYTEPIAAGKYLLKAIAVVPEYPYTVTETCSFALGQVQAPTVVLSSEGNEFYLSGTTVTVSTETNDCEIRYTLDGSEPTETSSLYLEPFAINNTTTVKAKAFKTDWFDSETTKVRFTRRWYTAETPIIEPGETTFNNASQQVSISCDTEGAKILFTTDGSDPKTNGREYTKPFTVYKSCLVRAIAVKFDWKDSTESTATFTRNESLSEAANLYGYTMESDANAPWVVDTDVSHDGVSSVRSGTIANNGVTTLSASLRKAGTVSFWWRAKCENAEEEDGETYYYDYGLFAVDGNVVARIAGNDTGWQYVSHEISTGGKHVLSWEYRKDGATSYAPDCIWVDQVQWIPADGSGYTLTTPEPVPYAWLDQYNLGVGTDYETAGNAASGKMNWGKPSAVWEEYVAGLDPTNANSRFLANIEMREGAPFVSWTPDLNTNGIIRTYKVYGSETLENGGNWQYPTNSLHRFFRVKVEMP